MNVSPISLEVGRPVPVTICYPEKTDGSVALEKGTMLTPELARSLDRKNLNIGTLEREIHKNLLNIEKKTKSTFKSEAINLLIDKDSMEEVEEVLETLIVGLFCDYDLTLTGKILGRHCQRSFNHSTKVAVVSAILGYNLGFEKEDLLTLTAGGLFHDVGKSKISKSVLQKKGDLTKQEFRQIKSHPKYGMEILLSIFPKHPLLGRIAAEHHLPRYGVKFGSELHKFSQIVRIADVYGAMTEKRSYGKIFSPWGAYNIMIGEWREAKSKGDTTFYNKDYLTLLGQMILNSGKLFN